jgi:enoyl-CoA hydratase
LIDNPSVLFEIHEGGGWITLNRPQALNALNKEGVQAITAALLAWESQPTVQYVVIQGSGRAFCAGGDLRMVYEAEKIQHAELATEFFKLEYDLNLKIHNYSKPYISLLDGITMGGGLGLSIHGTYRVATENTLMAMPETSIGFFPDVGAAWYLNRCPGETGLYLGLTSARIGPEDALYLGLATHYVPSAGLESLIQDMQARHGEELSLILQKHHHTPAGESSIKARQSMIDGYFNQPTIEAIFQSLSCSDTSFAKETLAQLKLRSPLSLRTTFEHFKKLENCSIEEVMAADLALAISWEKSSEFIEGIRAAVIDKDQKPRWASKPIAY